MGINWRMSKCAKLVKSVSCRFGRSPDYFQQFRYFSYQIIPHGTDFKCHFVLVLLLENWGTKVQPGKTQRTNTSQFFAGEKKLFQPHSSSGFSANFSVSAVSLLCEFGCIFCNRRGLYCPWLQTGKSVSVGLQNTVLPIIVSSQIKACLISHNMV